LAASTEVGSGPDEDRGRVQTDTDGDYIYTPDFSRAVPVSEESLSERIDALIAEDAETAARASGNRISLP
jgi:hypothetical protein